MTPQGAVVFSRQTEFGPEDWRYRDLGENDNEKESDQRFSMVV